MESNCAGCGRPLEAGWGFCPGCGQTVAKAAAEAEAHPAKRAPVKGAFTGLLFGMLMVPMLVIVGTMLCLTGLGAFLGVPLIVLAVFAPLLGPMLGIGNPQGSCPWCGTRISNLIRAPHFYCYACSKRVEMVDRRFERAE